MEEQNKNLNNDLIQENLDATLRSKAEALCQHTKELSTKDIESLSSSQIKEILHELQVHQIELEMQNDELRRSQEALAQSKKRYSELYDFAPIGYCTLSEQGLILEANLTAAKLFKTERFNLLKQPFTTFIAKEDQDIYYLDSKKMKETGALPLCEIRMVDRGNRTFWAHLTATTVQNSQGETVSHLVISDVNDYKKIEEELKEKTKVMFVQARQAAMGEMLSMIAHQWRQPLTAVGMLFNQLRLILDLRCETKMEAFEEIISNAEELVQYLSQIIDDFSDFFKPDELKVSVAVDEIIKSLDLMIGKTLLKKNIEFKVTNDSAVPLYIHKNALLQVLINIIKNAEDTLESKKITPASIRFNVKEKHNLIIITICDNGGGIPSSAIHHIAEPYYSTHEDYNGSGLGLYIAKTIIEKHLLGTFSWWNDTEGACFNITLKKEPQA